MRGLLIGELAKRAGVTRQTVRYYEQLGLLSPPARSPVGYRHYSESALDELAFVKRAQAIGFSLDDIREVVQLSRSGKACCTRVLDLAHKHLFELSERIEHLVQLREELAAAITRWEDGGVPENCARQLCGLIAGTAIATADRVRVRQIPLRRR